VVSNIEYTSKEEWVPVLRIRIRCFFYPWIQDDFLSDPGSVPLFWWNFLTLSSESLLCDLYETGLLLKLTPETISSKKKLRLLLPPPFYIGRRIRDPGWQNSRIRDKTWIPDPQRWHWVLVFKGISSKAEHTRNCPYQPYSAGYILFIYLLTRPQRNRVHNTVCSHKELIKQN
jgi:hypothetical protein